MFWASIWEKNDIKRIYLNAHNQRAKIWVEQVPESTDFRIRYKLDSFKNFYNEFALPLTMNDNDCEPSSIACKSFEVWQNSQNKKFKTWKQVYEYVKNKK